MADFDPGTLGLADGVEQFAEPRFVNVKRLAAGNAREFDGAQLVVLVFVVANHAANAGDGGFNGLVGAFLDELQVGLVGSGGAGEIAGLLHKHLFGVEQLGELVAEPLAGVDGIELRAERFRRRLPFP